MRRLLVLALVLSPLAACKGDRDKCEKAARNYATLVYWGKADAALSQLPESERANARSKMQTAFDTELEGEITAITSQCVSANNDDMVDCMIKAKTSAQALKCASAIEPGQGG